MFVCMLPFFSATAEPFALKLGMVFWNGTGKTAKHFGVHWMRNYRVIAYALCVILDQNEPRNWNCDVTMPWFHFKCIWRQTLILVILTVTTDIDLTSNRFSRYKYYNRIFFIDFQFQFQFLWRRMVQGRYFMTDDFHFIITALSISWCCSSKSY